MLYGKCKYSTRNIGVLVLYFMVLKGIMKSKYKTLEKLPKKAVFQNLQLTANKRSEIDVNNNS